MSDADNKLHALWAENEPRARDPAFVAEVMERIARRRFRFSVCYASLWASVAAVLLWAVGPTLETALGAFPLFREPIISGLLASVAVGAWLFDATFRARSRA